MLDSPVDQLLKQRIRELEREESHLRKQLSQFEVDNENLQTITRNDKNLIHDLHVRIRELQLTEESLKTQLRIVEEEENELVEKIMTLTDRVEELERLLRRTTKTREMKQENEKEQEEEEIDKDLIEKSHASRSLESETYGLSDIVNEELENLRLERENLKRNEEMLKNQIQTLNLKVCRLKTEHEVHGLEIDTKHTETQTSDDTELSDSKLKKLEKENEALKINNSGILERLKMLQNNYDELNNEIPKLNSKMSHSDLKSNPVTETEHVNEILSENFHLNEKIKLLKIHTEDLNRKYLLIEKKVDETDLEQSLSREEEEEEDEESATRRQLYIDQLTDRLLSLDREAKRPVCTDETHVEPFTDIIQPVVEQANYSAAKKEGQKKLKNGEMKQKMDELADVLLHLDGSNRDDNFGEIQETEVFKKVTSLEAVSQDLGDSSQLEELLKETTQELEMQQKMNASLQDQQQQTMESLTQLKMKNSGLVDKLQRCEERLKTLEGNELDKNTERKQLTQLTEETLVQLEAEKQRCVNVQKQLEELEMQITRRDNEEKEKLKNLTDTNAEILVMLDTEKRKNTDLENQLTGKISKLEDEKKTQLERQFSIHEETISLLDLEKEKSNRLDEQVKALEQQQNQLEADKWREIERLTKITEDQSLQLNAERERNSVLQNQVKDSDETWKLLETMARKNVEVEETLGRMEEEFSKSNTELEDQIKKIKEMEEANEQLKRINYALDSEKHNFQHNLSSERHRRKDLEEELEKVRSEVCRKDEETQMLISDINSLNIKYEEKFKMWELELKSSQSRNKELKTVLDELNLELKASMSELERNAMKLRARENESDVLSQEAKYLKRKIQELETEVDTVETAKTKLTEELRIKEETGMEFQVKNKNLMKQNINLQNELSEKESAVSRAEDKLRQEEDTKLELTMTNRNLQNHILEIRNNFGDLENSLQKTKEEIQKREEQEYELNLKNRNLMTKLIETQTELSEKEKTLQKIKHELQLKEELELNSSIQVKHFYRTLNELQNNLEEKENYNQKLKEALSSKEANEVDLNAKIKALQTRVVEIQNALSEANSETTSANNAVSRLKQNLTAKDEELAAIVEVNQMKEMKMNEMEKERELVINDILVKRKVRTLQSSSFSEEINMTHREEFKKLINVLHDKEQEQETVKDEVEKLNRLLRSKEKEMAVAEERETELSRRLKLSQNQLKECKSELEDLDEKFQINRKTFVERQKELEAELDDRNSEMLSMRSANERLKERIKSTESALDASSSVLREKEMEIGKLNKELKNVLDSLKEEQQRGLELKKIQMETKNMENITQLLTETEEALERERARILQREMEISELKGLLLKKDEELKVSMSNVNLLNEKCIQQQIEKEAEVERLHLVEAELRKALHLQETIAVDQVQELERVKQRLKEEEQEAEVMEKTGKDVDRKISQLNTSIESMEEWNRQLEQQLQRKDDQIQELEARIADEEQKRQSALIEAIKQKETSETGLRQEIQRLRNQVTAAADQEKVIKELEQHCAQLRKEYDELTKYSLQTSTTSKQLSAEVDQLKGMCLQKDDEMQQLLEELSRCEEVSNRVVWRVNGHNE